MNSNSLLPSRAWLVLNPTVPLIIFMVWGRVLKWGLSVMDQLNSCFCHSHLLYSWSLTFTEVFCPAHTFISNELNLENRISDGSHPLKNAPCLCPSLDINLWSDSDFSAKVSQQLSRLWVCLKRHTTVRLFLLCVPDKRG